MEFEQLRQREHAANMLLPQYGLVALTGGNVSETDRDVGFFAIKPSGVSYEALRSEDIVVPDFEGHVVSGDLKSSYDTKTYMVL